MRPPRRIGLKNLTSIKISQTRNRCRRLMLDDGVVNA